LPLSGAMDGMDSPGLGEVETFEGFGYSPACVRFLISGGDGFINSRFYFPGGTSFARQESRNKAMQLRTPVQNRRLPTAACGLFRGLTNAARIHKYL